ncbi:WXG100-like domain-containing protein [Nocardia amikacinitolerans]|uniref:WXG100-like domain-containing protein n=1 Tax=Nocardia amikacinitolerans TaxID=756689 RepID=UPI0020A2C7F4|nr:hypothetical protein [Nocardia amikacinitolerans]MCP2288201.1 hypothetical protein [Nocardia amikacinitolerans]
MPFNDAAPPAGNDLIDGKVDDDEAYGFDQKALLPRIHSDGAEAGLFKGTPLGDAWEASGLVKEALNGEDPVRNLYGAALKASSVAVAAADVLEYRSRMAKGVPLAKFDPFNIVGALLMGWMLENVEPLRKALDWVTGNPDMVKAYSKSWENISGVLTRAAATWNTELDKDVSEWAGAAGAAYKAKADAFMADIEAQASLATSLSKVNAALGDLVEGVRGVVTELLNWLAGVLVEAAAIIICTGGTASFAAVARASTSIAGAGTKLSSILLQLAKEASTIIGMVPKLIQIVQGATEASVRSATA